MEKQVECPQCDGPIGVEFEYQPDDYSVGISEGWGAYLSWADCECEITEKDLDRIADSIWDEIQEENAANYY
jgi:hypothetical protein